MTSRREFLKQTGVLIVSLGHLPPPPALELLPNAQGQFGTQDVRVGRQVDSWLAIAADGSVTAYTGKAELGQGMFTAQTQLVAEELSVPIARVTLIQCDTSVTPDQGTTSGSQSTPTNFNERGLAKCEIGLAKGKRKADKREAEKAKDWQRDKARLMRDKG